MLSILIPFLLVVLVIVCILLTLVVLMQRPRSEGLGAAFGSGMTENIFGAQTTTVLTKATVYLGIVFFAVTLLLTVLTARQGLERRVGLLENETRKASAAAPTHPAPAATAASPSVPASPRAEGSPAPLATPLPTPGSATSSPTASVTPLPAASPAAATAASPKNPSPGGTPAK